MVVLLAFSYVADHGFLSDRTNLCEFRIFLYFNSPSLVIGEVPVESVELVYFHDVEVSLDCIHSEEVSRLVKVHTTISESWCVINLAAR